MSYEWHVEFRLNLSPWEEEERRIKADLRRRGKRPRRSNVDKEAKKRLCPALEGRGRFTSIRDRYARLRILAQAVGADGGGESRWSTLAKGVYLEKVLGEAFYASHLSGVEGTLQHLHLRPPPLGEEDLALLPEHSFFLYVPFTLAAPYVSKDDVAFYVHENPVRKEWVFRVPMVGSTSWKGAFRAALRYALDGAEDADPRIVRLMGNPKGVEGDSRRGRLVFFPTFFDALEVEVINPHDRKTGAGTKPIHIETVPKGARGVFALLYVPAFPADPKGPPPAWEEVLEDLDRVGQAAYALLAEYGFGAKTASGMGRAAPGVPGAYLLVHRWVSVAPDLPPQPFPEEPPKPFRPDTDEFLDEKRGRTERRMVRVDLVRLDDLKALRQRVEEQVKGGNDG